jgi:hypothetical protein
MEKDDLNAFFNRTIFVISWERKWNNVSKTVSN